MQIHDFEVLPNVLVITGSAVKRGHPHSQGGGVCGLGWHIMSCGNLRGWRVVPGHGGQRATSDFHRGLEVDSPPASESCLKYLVPQTP